MILNKLQQKRRQKFYVKMYLSYSVISLISVIIATTFFLSYVSGILTSSSYTINKNLLSQVKTTSDNYVFLRANSLFSRYFNTYNPHHDYTEFFNSTSAISSTELFKVYSNLIELTLNNPFISSIYIYNPSSKTLISSKSGISFEESVDRNQFAAYEFSFPLIKQKFSLNDISGVITPKENMDYASQPNLMTFYQMIKTNNNQGCFVGINVDTKEIIGFTDNLNQQVAVVYKNGDVIAHSNKNALNQNYLEFTKVEETDNIKVVKIGKQKIGIIATKSSVSDFTYMLLIPLDTLYSSMRKTQTVVVILTFILILGILGILYVITTRIYSPINSLFENVKSKIIDNKIPSTGDELETINNAINSMNDQIVVMQESFKENENLILNSVIEDILYKKIETHLEIERRLSLVGIDFHCENKKAVFLNIQINQNSLNKDEYTNNEFIIFNIMDKIKEYFYDCFSLQKRKSSSVITAILISEDEASFEKTKYFLEFLTNSVNSEINLAISNVYYDLLETPKYSKETDNYLKYTFICGYSNLFTSEFIDRYENSQNEIKVSQIKDVESLLRATNIDKAKLILSEHINFIKTAPLSYHNAQNIILQWISMISRVTKDYSITHDELSKNYILKQFEGISGVDDCEVFICYLLDIFKNASSDRTSTINVEFMDRIAKYISMNIDNNLSLESVASEFSISPSYLSKMFKEKLDINFSNYLIEAKFEKAKDLLENSNMTIADIADKIGYLNISYFIKLFKERYSLTPLQYRKMKKKG